MNREISRMGAPLDEAIEAVRGGDVDAFDRVVREFQEPLRAFMLSRAPSPAAADDLAQMAFVTAFSQLQRYDASSPFGPWLWGIARNILRRAWEKAGTEHRHRPAIADFLRRQLEQDLTAPEQSALRVAALRHCLETLPENWREIVKQHYEQRLSLAGIAEKQGNTASTVGVTLFRIRKRLRGCIERRLENV